MGQEKLEKDYILLSRVAKEKKYAQEYLGLLARRGDIGSIRIGKRWYTTEKWFSEFLQDAEARKSGAKGEKVRTELTDNRISEKGGMEKVFSQRKAGRIQEETGGENFEVEGKPVPLKLVVSRTAREKNLGAMDIRMARANEFSTLQKGPADAISSPDRRIERYVWREAVERERMLTRDFSPNFAQPILKIIFFQRFVFSAVMVLTLVLLFQFGWVYKDELGRMVGFEPGTVAGEEDTNFSLAAVKSSSLGYLGRQVDKVKENISLSRVLIKAVMERNSGQQSVTNAQ